LFFFLFPVAFFCFPPLPEEPFLDADHLIANLKIGHCLLLTDRRRFAHAPRFEWLDPLPSPPWTLNQRLFFPFSCNEEFFFPLCTQPPLEKTFFISPTSVPSRCLAVLCQALSTPDAIPDPALSSLMANPLTPWVSRLLIRRGARPPFIF